jgi:TRAP-type C4-dicarboxylate transport system permease small subunit
LLSRFIKKFYAVFRPLNSIVITIGLAALTAMMFLTAVDVTLRKTLNKPILGSYEIIEFFMAITISFAVAYCALQKGHIIIDLIVSHFNKFWQAIIGCITASLSLAIGIVVTWQLIVYVPQMKDGNTLSPVLLIPLYPFVGIVAFGFILYSIILFVNLMERLAEAKQ